MQYGWILLLALAVRGLMIVLAGREIEIQKFNADLKKLQAHEEVVQTT